MRHDSNNRFEILIICSPWLWQFRQLTLAVQLARQQNCFQFVDHGRAQLEKSADKIFQLRAGDRVDVQARLRRVGEKLRILHRVLERLAQDFHAIFWRALRQDVGTVVVGGILDAGLDQLPRFVRLGQALSQWNVG